jgi:O-antigen biosynthesis protein
MKAWMIKLGKAMEALKRDGFVNGSQKLIRNLFSFFGMMKKLPGGDILFITKGVGDSALYRSHHNCEELNLQGFKSFVTISDSPYLMSYADSFKIFVFQKTAYDERIGKFIEKIKSLGKEIIFETDDLLFDAKYFENVAHIETANILEKQQYSKSIGGEIVDDAYVKVCVASTTYLADKLREKNKKVFVVPNKLSKKDVEICENILKNKIRDTKDEIQNTIKLGYFSGTASHNKDFAEITDALMQIMEKFPNVELCLVGPLDLESELVQKFKNRIQQLPYVPREKHFENISKVDINLAPLEINNPFCQAKSELKFFEAGALKVPTVASATETFKEAISDGVDGFAASNTAEWADRLSRLILEPDLRRQMGEKARKKALSRYTTQNADNVEYYDYLKSKL